MTSPRRLQLLLAKKLIKPSAPTPHQNYKLSLIDQLCTSRYMPIALFYPGNRLNHDTSATLLENSLSTLLNVYYPFAGRIENNLSVNCNNMGAAFLETRVHSTMLKIIKGPQGTIQNTVFPQGFPWRNADEKEGIPLAVQLNHFDCGGKALGICLSHKLADGSALINFLSDWAGVAHTSQKKQALQHKPSPQWTGASICPPVEDPQARVVHEPEDHQPVAKRLFFSASKINQLKARVASESGLQNPSRFEVLSAFIINRVAATANLHSDLSNKPYIVTFTANFHHLVTPPIPQTAVGNFFAGMSFLIANAEEMTLSTLVKEFRRKKEELHEKYTGVKYDELELLIIEEKEKAIKLDGFEYSLVSNLLKFPFHKVDFGWGKPSKVTLGGMPFKNGIFLINDPNGDGVEAIVSIDKQIVSLFETDPEILKFAAMDPTD